MACLSGPDSNVKWLEEEEEEEDDDDDDDLCLLLLLALWRIADL